MNGVIVIDKPKQFTSFDVVAVMRGITGQGKIGHCGTLDPNATGVLPILLGAATRAQDIIPDHDKEYIASFKLGITTDTLDIWGNVTSKKGSRINREQICNALDNFRGEIYQTPPMYSAIRINGRRLYDLARNGIEIERQSRKITVYSLSLLSFDEKEQNAEIKVKCSKGTYIRSLIDDIGAYLSCGAVMTALRRTYACGFSEKQAITIKEVQDLAADRNIQSAILPTESLFEAYEILKVTDKQAVRFSNGGSLDLARTAIRDCTQDKILRVCTGNGEFIGLGMTDIARGELRIYKLFQKI